MNVLFYAVRHWNDFFAALLYLPDKSLQPMQLFLRNILIEQSDLLIQDEVEMGYTSAAIYEKLKYSVIIVTMLPIMLVYPFLQKYFVKGVMIGALKG